MKRSNLIPITRIYDIYPKYTYSEGVKKFMDEIIDIDRANVYTKDEVITMFTELQSEIEERRIDGSFYGEAILDCAELIQEKINALKGEE